jgi:hypothetical protein
MGLLVEKPSDSACLTPVPGVDVPAIPAFGRPMAVLFPLQGASNVHADQRRRQLWMSCVPSVPFGSLVA